MVVIDLNGFKMTDYFNMFRNSLIITLFFFFNGILGFVCQMLYGAYFGVGADMDMYYKLLSIPTIVTGTTPVLFASLLIPLYPVYEKKGVLDAFFAEIHHRILYLNICCIALVGILTLSSMLIFNNGDMESRYVISVLLWVSAFFSIMNGLYSSILNYKKRFTLVASLSSSTYVGIIFLVYTLHDKLGVTSIALGMLLASLFNFIIMKVLVKSPFSNVTVDISYRDMLANLFYIVITLVPFTTYAAIAYLWAEKLAEGSVSYLGYSHSFEGFLSVAASMGIATVSFPDIAKQLCSDDYEVRRASLFSFLNVIKIVFLFLLIFVVYGCFFCQPIISFLLGRGEFAISDVENLSKVLPVYFISGSMIAILNLIRNVYYSLGKEKTFAIIALITTVFFGLSSFLIGTNITYVGVGMFECTSFTFIVFFSVYTLNKEYHILTRNLGCVILKESFSVLAIGFTVKFVCEQVISEATPFITLLISGTFYFLLLFFAIVYILKVPELVLFVNKLKKEK